MSRAEGLGSERRVGREAFVQSFTAQSSMNIQHPGKGDGGKKEGWGNVRYLLFG